MPGLPRPSSRGPASLASRARARTTRRSSARWTTDDLQRSIARAHRLPHLLTTVAAETVTPEQIARARRAPASSSASATPTRAIAHVAAAADSRRDDGHASLQRAEPDRQSRARRRRRRARPRHAPRRPHRRRHPRPPRDASASRCAPSAGPASIFLVTDAMSVTGTDARVSPSTAAPSTAGTARCGSPTARSPAPTSR